MKVRKTKEIAKEGIGVVPYMRQEGRGIDLINPLKACALQNQGDDTVEAKEPLGFKAGVRDYGIGAQWPLSGFARLL